MPLEVPSLVNGEPATGIDLDDAAFNYGDGLFETIAVRDGQALLWPAHFRRLADGARRLRIPLADEHVFVHEAERLCRHATTAVLKIIITRGSNQPGEAPDGTSRPTRVLRLLPARGYPETYWRDGVALGVCQWRLVRDRQLAGIKHLCRLPQVMARAEWQDEFAEGLMLDDLDNVIEGTKSNVFIVTDGRLRTPDLSHTGVWGVARAWVMEHAQAIGLQVSSVELSLSMIRSADEIFLTNSLIGLWPVRQFEGKAYPVGPVAKALQKALAVGFPVPGDL